MQQIQPTADEHDYGNLQPRLQKPDLIYAEVERDTGENPDNGVVPMSTEIPKNNEILYSELQSRVPPSSHDVYANI